MLRLSPILVAILLLLIPGLPGKTDAHELIEGVGTQATFTLRGDDIVVLFNHGWSTPAGFPVLSDLDEDGDGKVREPEWRPYLEKLLADLLPSTTLTVNGFPIDLELQLIEQEGIGGSVSARSFDVYYTLIGKLPEPLPDDAPWGAGGWWLHWHDQTHLDRLSSQITWIPLEDHSPRLSVLVLEPGFEMIDDQGAFLRTPGRKSLLHFHPGASSFDPFSDTPPSAEVIRNWYANTGLTADSNDSKDTDSEPIFRPSRPPGESPGDKPPIPTEEEEIGNIVETIVSGKAKLWEILLALFLAIIYGAGHALGPGHGKTMVAAYLVYFSNFCFLFSHFFS